MSDLRFLPRQTFLGLPDDEEYRRRAACLLLPIPYDLTQSGWVGARFGPAAILTASTQIEEYDLEAGWNPSREGIATLAEMAPVVSGPAAMVDEIARAAGELMAGGQLLAALGGDHTVTLGLVRAHRARYPDLSVVTLDAHADLRDHYQGSPIGHATVMRRVSEMTSIALLGYRSLAEEEAEFLEARTKAGAAAAPGAPGAIAAVPAAAMKGDPAAAWRKVAPHVAPRVYVSLDVDVLDPSLMPAVGTPEPGGLGWEDVVGFLDALTREREVVGCDLVEHLPLAGFPAPSVVAAKLLYRMVGFALRGRRRH